MMLPEQEAEMIADLSRHREALKIALDTLKLYAEGEDAGFPYAAEALPKIAAIIGGTPNA